MSVLNLQGHLALPHSARPSHPVFVLKNIPNVCVATCQTRFICFFISHPLSCAYVVCIFVAVQSLGVVGAMRATESTARVRDERRRIADPALLQRG
jgi:hypothetical protein